MREYEGPPRWGILWENLYVPTWYLLGERVPIWCRFDISHSWIAKRRLQAIKNLVWLSESNEHSGNVDLVSLLQRNEWHFILAQNAETNGTTKVGIESWWESLGFGASLVRIWCAATLCRLYGFGGAIIGYPFGVKLAVPKFGTDLLTFLQCQILVPIK